MNDIRHDTPDPREAARAALDERTLVALKNSLLHVANLRERALRILVDCDEVSTELDRVLTYTRPIWRR